MEESKANLVNPIRNVSSLSIMSSYQLSSSDNLGSILVTKLLIGDRFSNWSKVMCIMLNAKNKLGFINGTLKQPDISVSVQKHGLWQRCNDMVLSWLLN